MQDGKNAWDLADGAGYDDIKELLQPPDRPFIPAVSQIVFGIDITQGNW